MEIPHRGMKFYYDYDDQGFILLRKMTSLIRILNMLCMFSLLHELLKNVIYRVDVRQFIVAGIPC